MTMTTSSKAWSFKLLAKIQDERDLFTTGGSTFPITETSSQVSLKDQCTRIVKYAAVYQEFIESFAVYKIILINAKM